MHALREVNLRFDAGEFVAVIGHNGSGKSTMARLTAALLYPTAGEILVDAIPVRPATRWQIRERISIVFQDPDNQLVTNRVLDDVAFGPENLGLPRPEIARRVNEALVALELEGVRDRLIGELSEGQKQRVAIAGALAMQPQFLVLDEPTAFLPLPLADRLLQTMRCLNAGRGMGVIHITHFMREAAMFDRVVVLDAGQVVLDGSPAEVFEHADRLHEIGLDIPLAAQMARRLRGAGVQLPPGIVTASELRDALARVQMAARRA